MSSDYLRKLDAEFAREVLGCSVSMHVKGPHCGCRGLPHGDLLGRLHEFSTYLTAAWPTKEVLGRLGIDHFAVYQEPYEAVCDIGRDGSSHVIQCSAETPALAVVRALLKAVRDE